MKIQYVSRYIALSEEGLVPRFECPMDQGLLLCNQDESDAVYLYCLSCEYKNFIGSDFYNQLVRTVEKVESR
jgi:hypothetical protein